MVSQKAWLPKSRTVREVEGVVHENAPAGLLVQRQPHVQAGEGEARVVGLQLRQCLHRVAILQLLEEALAKGLGILHLARRIGGRGLSPQVEDVPGTGLLGHLVADLGDLVGVIEEGHHAVLDAVLDLECEREGDGCPAHSIVLSRGPGMAR
jgi:hypothetical protein